MTQTLLEIVQHQFGLEIIETTAPLVTPRPLHELLLGQWMIEADRDRISPKTNEATRGERHCWADDDQSGNCPRTESQLLKLEGAIVTLEQTISELDPLDRVASILTAMVV
ncbi:MAG: hypothetical protein HY785_18390 [Oscillatoriophycideae cyanobacterium NC_groundwater_1537_Pr4_S-0.65um_50_18]|nr:hypothetical protein [Oscillatoriophycideae cyanobacterium NC_groundwater_1537_Pr4_S-0.65um_50_18]